MSMVVKNLRSSLIRIAHENPELRSLLLPVLTQDREAGFSQPDPRNTVREFVQAQQEFKEYMVWSHALLGSLNAVRKDYPVAEHLRALKEAEVIMKRSLDALAPVVETYFRAQTMPVKRVDTMPVKRVDPRTL